MQVTRFDFSILQDFCEPISSLEIVSDQITAEAEEEIVPPPPPTFSEDELEAAKKAAFEDGKKSGIQQGLEQANTQAAQLQKQAHDAVQHILAQTQHIQQEHRDALTVQCSNLSDLVMLIARKVAGDAIAQTPTIGIETMVRDCLSLLMRQPHITVQVAPALVDDIQDRIHSLIPQTGDQSSDVTIIANESLGMGEGKLSWQDGAAERQLEPIWQQIAEKVAQVDFTATLPATHNPTEQTHDVDVEQQQGDNT